jgi:hypothetical protein
MLKEKKVYTVITFPNTTAALAMEESCKADGVAGELIPVPNSITAGCGFAWQAAEEEKDNLVLYITGKGLKFSEIYTIEL